MASLKTKKEALKNLVLDQAAAKIRYFDSKILEMSSGYKMNFKDFTRGMEERKGKEVYEERDDHMPISPSAKV